MAETKSIESVEDDARERPKGPRGAYSSDDLLNLVREERRRALSLEQDQELRASWERSLNYYKGRMDDIPSLPNRSAAVSSDISDAVETILPDLMEIFTGGDDVAAFIPNSEQDEQGAVQETDFVTHVVFQDNPGFLNFYSVIKDALLQKIGVFKYWWGEDVTENDEEFEGKSLVELQLASQDGEVSDLKEATDETGQVTYSFSLKQKKDRSTVKIVPVPPEDFGVAPDTIRISETSYCFMRSRPRAQDLRADGYDDEIVDALPMYGFKQDQAVQLSRDQAGEHLQQRGDDPDDMRVVEIFEHYIRLMGNDGKLHYWKVVTNFDDTKVVDYEEVDRVPFAVGSPYLVSHRFFGRSLSDMLIEVQRIKTALTRALLDSCYFALNQRYEVAVGNGRANEFTISDLLDNTPGMPVRSQDGTSIRALSSGALGFDAYGALEFFSTVSEQRTGIVRNAQGLNPDTLHDTAKGAMALMGAAQKRTRMIARCIAETCIKELFLGVHALLRENASTERQVKLRGKWAKVDPSSWGERENMTIEVGLGASGKDAEIMALNQLGGVMKSIVEMQGGSQGPLVTLKNIYNASSRLAQKLGFKAPELFFTDPESPEVQQQQQAPKPDPEMIKVQGELQISQQKLQNEQAIESAKVQARVATDQHLNELEAQREQMKQQGLMQLEQLKIQSAERIAIEVARINAEARISAAQITAKNQTSTGAETLAYEQANEGSV